jgi:hypothetical protein
MSIQALNQSLPELSDEAFERTYRQFVIKALAPVLGYEIARPREQKEAWDEILDSFEAERERRMKKREAQEPTQSQWHVFCKRLGDCQPRNRRKRDLNPPQNPG